MVFFYLNDKTFSSTLSCEFTVHRAGSQLKSIVIYTHKHRHLSIDMKKKISACLKGQLEKLKTLRVPSACLTFRNFLLPFRLGIGYCFHPKCGTSTWSVFLGKILSKNGKATGNGTFSNKTPKGWDRFRWNKWRRLTSRLLNTKTKESKGQENLDAIFKFSIVRHPFVRLVSTYQVMAYCNFLVW